MTPTTDYGIEESNKKALELIEDITANAGEVQHRVLAEILSLNGGVEYLQRLGLAGATDPETFKKMVPVITYEDIKSDINRIANGDTSPILCSDPVAEFFTSSGTSTGEMKLIPATEKDMERKSPFGSLIMPVITQYFPGLHKGKGMYFRSVKPGATTPGGLPAHPVTTSYFTSSRFLNRPYHPYSDYTSPNETILCPDTFQSIYSQLLCGLCLHTEVLRAGAVFASGFIWAIKFLEKHWSLLCKDIRTGTLNPRITDPSVRETVSRILKPDPELADLVEFECSKESWKGIVRKLWPNTMYVDVVATGSMLQYVSSIDYYTDGLPIVCMGYGSSEGFLGINLNPLSKPSEVAYTLLPSAAYFEFLPVHMNGEIVDPRQQDLVDLVDVELGQEYEVVVTTFEGLYRYRLGDVLRVAGFKNKAPQFNFVCRENVVLSIDCEKTNEHVLHNAVTNATKLLDPYGALLSEYTSFADTSTSAGHYVLFWELKEGPTSVPPTVLKECCLTVEESLHSEYRQHRVIGLIDPLEIKIVEAGTFDELMDRAVRLGASMNQYKAPRCVKSATVVELLNSRVVTSCFSPKCPQWVPAHNINNIDSEKIIKS